MNIEGLIDYNVDVKIKGTEVIGRVVGICLRPQRVEYQLAYILSAEPRAEWFYDFQLEVVEEKKKAGFVNYEPSKTLT